MGRTDGYLTPFNTPHCLIECDLVLSIPKTSLRVFCQREMMVVEEFASFCG